MDYSYEANLTTDDDGAIGYSASKEQIAKEVVLTIALFAGVCADICIFFTLFCYKRVRSVSNTFLANWAVADMLCLMMTPSSYQVLTYITHYSLEHELLCVLSDVGSTLHFTTNTFVILVLIDWFLVAYFGRASERFHRYYVHVIGTVWTLSIVIASVSTSVCFHYYSLLMHHLLLTASTYCLVLLLVIVLQTSRVIQKLRKSPVTASPMNLNLATAFIGCTILSVIMVFTRFFLFYVAAEVLFFVLLFSSGVVNLSLLWLFDKDFKSCLKQAVKCRSNQYDDVLDFNNPIRNNGAEHNISFRISQELLTSLE